MKPIIVINFVDWDSVEWKSAGWGNDAKLMAKAKRAINKGNDPGEVMDLLRRAGFIVVENTDSVGEVEK